MLLEELPGLVDDGVEEGLHDGLAERDAGLLPLEVLPQRCDVLLVPGEAYHLAGVLPGDLDEGVVLVDLVRPDLETDGAVPFVLVRVPLEQVGDLCSRRLHDDVSHLETVRRDVADVVALALRVRPLVHGCDGPLHQWHATAPSLRLTPTRTLLIRRSESHFPVSW